MVGASPSQADTTHITDENGCMQTVSLPDGFRGLAMFVQIAGKQYESLDKPLGEMQKESDEVVCGRRIRGIPLLVNCPVDNVGYLRQDHILREIERHTMFRGIVGIIFLDNEIYR
jgi:hypothetical protein